MAMSTGQLAVTTAAALVASPDADGCRVICYVVGNASIYLGASTVTTATGLLLDKAHGVIELRLRPGENLYAITGATETLTYMILEN